MLNLKNLDPKQKKSLITGAAAGGALLIAALALSLSSEDSEQAKALQEAQEVAQQNSSLPINNDQIPASQRYDFNRNEAPRGDGIESLLKDTAPGEGEIDLNNNPFAGMQGQSNEEMTAPAAGEQVIETLEKKQYTLYCDNFASAQEAESNKAMLAFQGISAAVVQAENSFRLKIGPFDSADAARKSFNDLGQKGLVRKCSLIGD